MCWTLPFEGYYRRVKFWAQQSNHKSVLHSTLKHLSMQFSYDLSQ
jgi:hypothetical protein